MKIIACVEACSGKVFGVRASDGMFVWELKELIKEKNQYTFPAKDIGLYRAKVNRRWLLQTESNLEQLKNKYEALTMQIKCKANRLEETLLIESMHCDFPDDGCAKQYDIHLFVDLPDTKGEALVLENNGIVVFPQSNTQLNATRRYDMELPLLQKKHKY